MKDYSTVFPDDVDKLCFFQDVSIDKLPIMDQYNEMIAIGHYSDASEYLNTHEISFYGAWLLNMLQERLIAIENYIVHGTDKPDLTTYNDIEPTDKEEGYCWT